MTDAEHNELLRALVLRPSGSGYGAFGEALHRHVPFDRLTLYVAEGDGQALRVLQALAGGDGTSDVVGRLLPADASLAGRALREARVLRVDEVPPLGVSGAVLVDLQRAAQAGLRSGLSWPLLLPPEVPANVPDAEQAAPQVIGVAQLWSRQRAFFTATHEARLQAIAPALAATLRNDLLFVGAERRSLELLALERLALATRRSLDLDEVLPVSLNAALSLLGLSVGGILLLRGGRLCLAQARNLHLSTRACVPLSPGEVLPGDMQALPEPLQDPLRACFLEQRPALRMGLDQHPRVREVLGPERGPGQWLLALPLRSAEGVRGVVFACGQGSSPMHAAAELDRLATVGHWIGSAIADAERHGLAREQASANVLYRHLITHLHDAVVATDPAGRIVEWTGGAERQSGWTRAEVLGRDLMELLFGERAEEVRAAVAEQLGQRGLYRGEGRVRCRDGSLAHWETLLARTELPGGHGLLGVCRDVGEARQKAEEQRKQRQLESLASLAGGLAHDFNNTLAAVLLTALLVRDAARAGGERLRPAALIQDMDVVIDAAKRGASLAGQLLAFSRGAPLDAAPLSVNQLLEDALRELRGRPRGAERPESPEPQVPQVPREPRDGEPRAPFVGSAEQRGAPFVGSAEQRGAPFIEVHLGQDLPPTRGDRQQLGRALLNLLQNARESTAAGGRIVCRTELCEHSLAGAGGRAAFGEALPLGRVLRITIADEGAGIDPQIRARLFEPFVTTRPGAAGLGLAVVFGVVKAHGGWVAVRSAAPGETTPWAWPPATGDAAAAEPTLLGAHGTTVVLELPVTGAAPERLSAPRPPEATAAAARVLVVDDEPVLTRIAARVLRGAGYTVDAVGSGVEALVRYQRAGAYDLVLLDATMPGMSGREVLEQILGRDPGARVLVMSGYSGESGPAQLLRDGARRFLPKPFTPQELLQAVTAVLSDSAPA